MFILPIGISVILFNSSLFDIQKIKALGTDFHYNTISMSATIGGFLFTGISILISTIDKDRVKRLWDNNYLNNLYRAAIVGMVSNIIGKDTNPCDEKNFFATIQFAVNEVLRRILPTSENNLIVIHPIAVYYGE